MTQRFTLDVAAERSTSQLRLVGAVAILGATGWIVVTHPGPIVWLVVVFAWLVALFWVVSWRRAQKRAAAAPLWYLELGTDELVLAEGERVVRLPWRDVRSVEVDDERLVVVVTQAAEPPLVIEPRYPGVSIEALAAAVRAHVGADVPPAR